MLPLKDITGNYREEALRLCSHHREKDDKMSPVMELFCGLFVIQTNIVLWTTCKNKICLKTSISCSNNAPCVTVKKHPDLIQNCLLFIPS